MILGVIQFFLIGLMCVYEYKNKSPITFMWATLVMMFGIMHLITVFNANYKYSNEVLNEASLFVILFCICYFVVRYVLIKGLGNAIKFDTSFDIGKYDVKIEKMVNCLLWGSVLIYAALIIKTSGSIFLVSKDNVYRTMATGSKLLLFCTYCYYACAPIILYYLRKRDKKGIIFTLIAILMRTFFSSARMDMIIIFVGVIGLLIIYTKKIDIKTIMILAVLGIVVIFSIYSLRTFRYYYSFSDIKNINWQVFFEQMGNFIETDDGELGLRQSFYYFIDNDNNFSGFGKGDGYLRVALFFMPSKLTFGIKPEDMGIVMGRAYHPMSRGIIAYTLTPTLYGDCYANFGFWGFMLGMFWALMATIFDYLINRKNCIIRYLLYGLLGTLSVNIGRGEVYNPICYIWYSGLIIGCIFFLRRVVILRKR